MAKLILVTARHGGAVEYATIHLDLVVSCADAERDLGSLHNNPHVLAKKEVRVKDFADVERPECGHGRELFAFLLI